EEKAIKGLVSNILFNREGIGRYLGGHFAGLIDFDDFVLVLCTDGVGSKVKIASAIKKWDTVGIDCIAMNVNDCICVGAEPIAFVDYLAIEDPDPKITKEIGKGLARGAEIANVSIAGGETATLPEIIRGFDLAGTCLGYVKKDELIMGDKIEQGDVIIGLESSGLHSNGYTLARRIIENVGLSYDDEFPDGLYEGRTIGEVLLTPTRIYVREVLDVIKNVETHGLAHITGGGVRNLLRLKDNVKFVLDNPFDPQPIFSFLQKNGNVEDKEMYQTFNMGMGFVIILPREFMDDALDVLERYKIKSKIVGYVEEGRGVDIPKLKLHYR
ncbi:MAG TPA: phosphoribosylformylglycinamidine cyclo-ligase, partial [Thermoplasmatales archaeon]|nr:phosphoribosylformylglycinamidine cyclo-ligase [Thermoplasmatales archaeon]